MSEAPEIPPPPPEIPQSRIWGTLLAPPAATWIGAEFAVRLGTPMDLSIVVLLVAIIVVACFAIFYRTLSKRYRGISMTLMESGFLTGQLIVCGAIGAVIVYLHIRFP